MDTLYPELEDYIYQYCGKFMTEDELDVKRTIMYGYKTQSELMRSMMKHKGWTSDDPRILAMIADGHQALKDSIVKRVWNEHRHELPLNLCPKCNKIARTPKARQCRYCSHDWH
ncbi:hypothetical protein HHL17_20420 [Chitinophaga sp. G-6-1-13]|uniref:Uncharacterized protein n=1 Tax=Chitinophaga fulva TaxID=2728842 RepID=A0A848GNP9_9BACT|nr:hypothetical protein [Chitinophaga fulva]NML39577.1 hypothetical protein [Chitinophaga fulva]